MNKQITLTRNEAMDLADNLRNSVAWLSDLQTEMRGANNARANAAFNGIKSEILDVIEKIDPRIAGNNSAVPDATEFARKVAALCDGGEIGNPNLLLRTLGDEARAVIAGVQ